jgi:hypothetical protein
VGGSSLSRRANNFFTLDQRYRTVASIDKAEAIAN